tara:strand:+ start:29 stop:538 length:510 start_codon:yes stop_codon:yes gene_type:complete
MKKNNKGFTLIELLVVVAIIGILAAVGVVAYNGYISSAKVSSTKAIHNNVMKFIASEYTKCSLDGSASNEIMKKGATGLSCNPGGDDDNPAKPTAEEVIEYLVGAGTPIEDKNPYAPGQKAITDAGGFSSGYVSLTATTESLITIETCHSPGTDCGDTDNQIENTVTLE